MTSQAIEHHGNNRLHYNAGRAAHILTSLKQLQKNQAE
jgi:hypothetical protein